MTIKQQGGIFGRNPTFNDLDVGGSANLGSNVDINGGAIDGAVIGAASPAASSFTSAKVIGSNTGAAVDVPNAVVVQNTAGSGFGQGAPVKFFHGAGDTDNNYTAALIGEYGTWSPTNGLGGGLGIYTKNSGVESKPSKKAEFTFAGNLAFNSGLGIDFSATAGTGTSELFDDYEEGTWTPVITGSGSNPTGTVVAKYTKVGQVVSVEGKYTFSTAGSGNYALTFASLPFTVAAGRITGTFSLLDAGTAWYQGVCSGDSVNVGFTTVAPVTFSSTTPFTVAASDELNFNFTYVTS